VRKALVYLLFFFWLFLLFIEAWIWANVQDLFLPQHPVMQMIAGLLQDTLWIPLGFALPAYMSAVFYSVVKPWTWRIMAMVICLALGLWALLDPLGYFRYLILSIVIYFVLLGVSIKKRSALAANLLVFSLALLGMVLHYQQQLLPSLYQPSGPTVSILNYNIRVNQKKEEREQVLSLIDRTRPDLVFIQEISSRDRDLFNQRFKGLYPAQLWSDRRENYNGGVILSKHPFLYSKNIDIHTEYSSGHFNLNHAMIELSGKQIHLLNGHLFPSGHAFIELLAGQRTFAGFLHDTRSTYLRRMSEADLLADHVRKIDGQIILAGDFNDTPHSYTYELFERTLQNAFRQAGWGLGTTFGHYSLKKSLSPFWAQFAFDFLRIDHVFVSSGIRIRSAEVLPLSISDHRAQMVHVQIK